ncbi:MAG: polyphosphate polymerase domain-containing protein [Ruminococcus sp.]|nr:polyphosphate polymerase domain-containing protein [Ruminococcus sp.]
MSKYKSEFLRIEKKYLLNNFQCQAILDAISKHMTEEKYGTHKISNIYYDTANFQLIRASIEKPLYKEKLRLRAYGSVTDESNVFVEIKKKFKGVVYKRRVGLTLDNARKFLNENQRQFDKVQVLREAECMLNLYNLIPKAAISYDRIAFFGNDDPEFRLTIDKNLKGRLSNLDLTEGTFGEEIIGQDKRLMEIKTTGGMPIWMCYLLSEFKIYPTGFSKYGEFYKNYVLNTSNIKDIETNYLFEKEMVKSA